MFVNNNGRFVDEELDNISPNDTPDNAHPNGYSVGDVTILNQFDIYNHDLSLLENMILHEEQRTAMLKQEGKAQIEYRSSTDGWIATLFMIKGRAADHMIFPWTVATLHAVAYVIIQEYWFEPKIENTQSWEIFFSFILNSTLSFLLVFRLNRAAGRFWSARHYWGDIVAQCRSCVGGLLVHGNHDLLERDNTIRWIIAFSIATMELLRGEKKYPIGNFAGILSSSEVTELEQQTHPAMYASDRARYHLAQLFKVTEKQTMNVALSRSQHLHSLENQINVMIWCGGGMERIRATPLPIVYVSHLRTFMMITLLLYPWVFGTTWRWTTIPAVSVAAFAWLGIEAAAVECESPFRKDRVNALNMDGYILGLIATIKQQLKMSK